jgi:glucose/arabinose dehydrogenase
LGVIVLLLLVADVRAQTLTDPALRVNTYVRGFDNPTGVAFLDANGTALVTEKDTGKVKLVENRQITKTVLDLPVANSSERGLLSVAVGPSFAADHFVYLYHTAAAQDGGEPINNKISRYVWSPISKTLTFERKIIDLPGGPGPNHDGGKIVFAPNGKLFSVIGELNRQERTANFENSDTLNLDGVVIRLQPNGKSIPTNPFPVLGTPTVQQNIWAYGIRNSFGLAFDPVTGDLWDTENGPDRMDEINRVPPGFNSGWKDIQGPLSRSGTDTSGLVTLGPRANYQDPKLSWVEPVAPTDLEFVNSSRLGATYRNDLIVGDVNTGALYHFELTSNRKSLALSGVLEDRVADNSNGDLLKESDDIIFGTDFGVTSDIINGPGGLFVLSLSNGALYRISERTAGPGRSVDVRAVPEPVLGLAVLVLAVVIRRKQ